MTELQGFGLWIVGALLAFVLINLFTEWLEETNDTQMPTFMFLVFMWPIGIPIALFGVAAFFTFRTVYRITRKIRIDATNPPTGEA